MTTSTNEELIKAKRSSESDKELGPGVPQNHRLSMKRIPLPGFYILTLTDATL